MLRGRGFHAPQPRAAALLLVGAAHQRALQRQLGPPAALHDLPDLDAIVEAALALFPERP